MKDKMLRIALTIIGIFNIADYFFTRQAVAAGMVEGNPFMDAILHTPWFPIVKLLAVPVGLYLLWRVRARVPRLRYYIWVPFVAYGLLTGWHAVLFFRGYS